MAKNIIIVLLSIGLVCTVICSVCVHREIDEYKWGAGKYGSKCYVLEDLHKGTTQVMYFKNYEECRAFVDLGKNVVE